MERIDQQMLTILALDPSACLRYSDYTRRWYVAADIAISNHVLIRWVGEHRPTPEQATVAFLEAIMNTAADEVVVTNEGSDHREWRWNGAAWLQIERMTP
jgi:3-deoxy-D-arabino-heptulosonate 7-phosphate (DAHP) synthase class II